MGGSWQEAVSVKKTIETKDLIIRESLETDLPLFHEWELRPEVTEFFSIPDGQSMEAVREKFFRDLADPGSEQFTITLKPDGKAIGRIVICDIVEGWKAELWRIYIADTGLRGKGYGCQAMCAMIRHFFEDLGLQRMYLDHYTGNPVSKLYLGLGFQYEGVLRHNCRKNGILYDVHLMSMLREEYEALKGSLPY